MDQFEQLPVTGRLDGTGHYDVRFIKKMVDLMEQGLSGRAITKAYQVSPRSLHRWILKYGSAEYVRSIQRSTSLPDKRTVVRAISARKLSIKEAVSAYQVSDDTIRRWQKEYGEKEELSPFNQQPLSKNKPQPDSEQVRQLQQQLAEAQLKIAALNTLIDVAEEQLKINIRKKPGARQS